MTINEFMKENESCIQYANACSKAHANGKQAERNRLRAEVERLRDEANEHQAKMEFEGEYDLRDQDSAIVDAYTRVLELLDAGEVTP